MTPTDWVALGVFVAAAGALAWEFWDWGRWREPPEDPDDYPIAKFPPKEGE